MIPRRRKTDDFENDLERKGLARTVDGPEQPVLVPAFRQESVRKLQAENPHEGEEKAQQSHSNP